MTYDEYKPLFTAVIDGVRKIFGKELDRIVLYGSVARGTNTPESDIDIAVIVTSAASREKEKKVVDLSSDLDLDYDVITSLITIDKKEYDEWKEYSPFFINLNRDGIVLWKNI